MECSPKTPVDDCDLYGELISQHSEKIVFKFILSALVEMRKA